MSEANAIDAAQLGTARFHSLDALRGIAVMGILLMNIIAFAFPEPAYLNPLGYGAPGTSDIVSWAAAFLLIDNKMRGLFTMLFGASMLLVYTQAQERSGTGASIHKRRMFWLLGFGLVHYYFIWNGDVLVLYALCGIVGMWLLTLDDQMLKQNALMLLAVGWVILIILAASMMWTEHAALVSGARTDAVIDYRNLLDSIGPASQAETAKELNLFRGDWWPITLHRLTDDATGPLELLLIYGAETLGLMALGMLLFRNGFLTGAWEQARYWRFAVRCYSAGFAGLAALLAWCFATGLAPVVVTTTATAWSLPFRILVMLGHAALAMLWINRFATSALIARVTACGRMAFSNYLSTSILMTSLFYGYGLGWFGTLTRWQAYALCLPVWGLMLLWSKPWLDRFHYGPFEWLWRSLARGSRQKMRR